MLIETIRAYLVELGIPEAEKWTHEDIVNHVDDTLLQYSKETPEAFEAVVDDFWINVKTKLLTLQDVLHKGLQ